MLPAEQKDTRVVERLVYHCLLKPLSHRVRVIIGLQNDIVAEEQRVDELLVVRGRLVNLGKLLWVFEEAGKALSD